MCASHLTWFLWCLWFLVQVGIAAGHLYHVLHASGRLEAPKALADAFASSPFLVRRYKAVAEEFALEGP